MSREKYSDTLGSISCGKTKLNIGDITRYDVPYWVCMIDRFFHRTVPHVGLTQRLLGENEQDPIGISMGGDVKNAPVQDIGSIIGNNGVSTTDKGVKTSGGV